jgi:hypothetical protein
MSLLSSLLSFYLLYNVQGLTETNAATHESRAIIEEELAGVPGSIDATTALLHFHVTAKTLFVSKQLRGPRTYTISFRTLQHAARMLKRFDATLI